MTLRLMTLGDRSTGDPSTTCCPSRVLWCVRQEHRFGSGGRRCCGGDARRGRALDLIVTFSIMNVVWMTGIARGNPKALSCREVQALLSHPPNANASSLTIVWPCTHTYTRTHTCTYPRTHMHSHARTHICTYTRARTHTAHSTHTRIHARTHALMWHQRDGRRSFRWARPMRRTTRVSDGLP